MELISVKLPHYYWLAQITYFVLFLRELGPVGASNVSEVRNLGKSNRIGTLDAEVDGRILKMLEAISS